MCKGELKHFSHIYFHKEVLVLVRLPVFSELLYIQQCTMNSNNSYFNFVAMWQSSKISAMYFLDKDSKLSNLFQQASSPTTGTAHRSQSRLSVCPSTQDICRYVLRKISSNLADAC